MSAHSQSVQLEKTILYSGIERIFSAVISALLILSCGPFFIIGGNSTIIILPFFALLLLLFMILFLKTGSLSKIKITRVGYHGLVASLFFFSILFIPFRQYDTLVAVSMWGIVFTILLIVDKKILDLSSFFFANTLFVIAGISTIVWILLLLGINVPFWEYNTGLIGVSKSTFFVYPGTAVLNGQDFELFGRTVYRMSGIFSEPGHYGIFCFFAYILGSRLSKFKRSVLVLSSLLSFSMGTYILWLGYILIANYLNYKRKLIIIILISAVMFWAYSFLPPDVLDRFVFSKIGSDATLDNRTDANFVSFYEAKHDVFYQTFGYGRLIFEELNLSNSDYRGFYLRFGIIGVCAYFLWVAMLSLNGKRRNNLLVFFVAIVIFVHRAWLIDYFILYYTLFFITNSEEL